MSGQLTEQQFRKIYQQAAAGDRAAFSTLYTVCAPLVYAVALSVLGQAADAEDVVSEVFLRLWQRREAYALRGRYRSWLSAVAYHAAVDSLRQKGRAPGGETALPAEPAGPSEEARICRKLTLQQAMAVLPEAQRQVVALHAVADLSLRETAHILGRAPGTVAWQYRAAVQKLREALAD